MRTDHGALRGANVYPGDSSLTEQRSYAGHTIRRGNLTLNTSGGNASLSPVLTAPSGVLTPGLVSKMNVLRGLDISYYIGHHRGGTLGNYGDSDNGALTYVPTCDQVLAWSNKFYEDLSGNLTRSMVLGTNSLSWGRSNPQNPGSSIQPMQATFSSLRMFDQVFRPPPEPTEQRTPVINRVYEDYKRLRDGNRRLSTHDRMRLEDHMSRVDELERKLSVVLACGDVNRPSQDSEALFNTGGGWFFRDPALHVQFWSLMNDVIVVAMSCDTSRIVTMRAGDMWDNSAASWFSNYAGDWHQDIAHQALTPGPQATLVQSNQQFFEHVFLDLATKLDSVDDPNGGKLLDSCAMFWTQESGPISHDPISMPIVMAGGANGWLRTGSFVDYCDRNVVGHDGSGGLNGEVTHIGLLYNQFLGTLMQAMGLDPADYESVPGGGFGMIFDDSSSNSWYAGYQKHNQAKKAVAGEALPYLKA
ncbi:MAG: DUF1552 domain-containing protein [Polyangiales bacterium]